MIWTNRHSCAFPYPELALIDCYYVESSTGRVLLFKITETRGNNIGRNVDEFLLVSRGMVL